MRFGFLARVVRGLLTLLCICGANVQAEERNGLSVNVVKKTLDRADRSASYYYDRIDRTQGLKVTIKNTTFKPMPEGEIDWTILVRQYASTAIEKHSGKEKLKALKPAEAAELVIGAAQITGWRDWGNQWKDKIEYQVIITQGGKETFRTASTNSFDILAKRAIKAPKRDN
jgi:hypothetical protein